MTQDKTGGAWQPIETAPTDGTVILTRNADHPYLGVCATLRHVEWTVDPKTGEDVCNDLGAWIDICDSDPSFGQSKMAWAPISIAADKYNRSVRREWMPLDAMIAVRNGGQDT